ncbi:MAG: SDR family oxidoreductase [Paracoccus sp. (in: a-proteobacteria)]|nr:SDR family oxidoreductase [Paracoccus sp. (in: a-proteobacteria)]
MQRNMTAATNWSLVTGAGSGIGAALAQELSARGLGVALVGRREANLLDVRDRIGPGKPVLVLPADIACAASRAWLYRTVAQRLASERGNLCHLVHNAGTGSPSRDFAGMDPAELMSAFAVNVTAPLALTQSFLPLLRRAAPARVLMVGAGIADRVQPGTGIYGITKKALARLFDQMVVDFAHEGGADLPGIALFQPGLVETEGLRDHIAAAKACDLPHAAWLDAALAKGEARSAVDVAKAMAAALLDLGHDAFHGQTLRPHSAPSDLGAQRKSKIVP